MRRDVAAAWRQANRRLAFYERTDERSRCCKREDCPFKWGVAPGNHDLAPLHEVGASLALDGLRCEDLP